MSLRCRRSPLSRHGGRGVVVLLAASLALTGQAGAAPHEPGVPTGRAGAHPHGNGDDALQGELRELVHRPDGPPGAIAVLREGGRVRVVRAGVADTDTGRPPRATDHMRLASAAKAFSGAVALRLVDRGRLRLNDTIAHRLPSLPASWGEVTLRQLLNHTSGLPDYSQAPEFADLLRADPHHVFDPRHLLDFVADQDLEFAPGSRYQYSNSDNIAIALLAEAATGRSYEELLASEVFKPLGLTGTSLPSGYRLPEPYLHGYGVEPGERPEDVSTLFGASGSWASGGLVSTPADFNTFMAGYAGGRLISDATRRQQRTFVKGASEPAGPGANRAGLAIFEYTTRCGVVYGHTGNTAGYTQLGVGTPDGRRSLTLSITTQVSQRTNPDLLAHLRAVEEDFVCALLSR
ncbi:D-alanyl-D-alanine carboxypeptidase [Streptomyces hundungensis]|uniref:D-alanyl-D-alanine carboxypeptidase n=1 Tax=Streptomyces hundungensis TaxID=1077946 RepID=A0A387HDP7_9ACTN|nr:serine hydrolase domain-containing protein [Streptomyces hundungensis]AYG78808.1 D-alanyl-D-alanine carboxypeptidase [Streptomyces hundungensis]